MNPPLGFKQPNANIIVSYWKITTFYSASLLFLRMKNLRFIKSTSKAWPLATRRNELKLACRLFFVLNDPEYPEKNLSPFKSLGDFT